MKLPGWLSKRPKAEDNVVEIELTIPPSNVNINKAVDNINQLSPKARATFLYRLVSSLPEDLLITLKKYTDLRLMGLTSVRKNVESKVGKATR